MAVVFEGLWVGRAQNYGETQGLEREVKRLELGELWFRFDAEKDVRRRDSGLG